LNLFKKLKRIGFVYMKDKVIEYLEDILKYASDIGMAYGK